MREDDERVRLCILSAIGGCVARSIRHGNPSINAAPRVHAVVNAVPARQAMLEQAGSEQAAQSEQLSALQVIIGQLLAVSIAMNLPRASFGSVRNLMMSLLALVTLVSRSQRM